jgi:intracellular multiplication protein IcmO
VAQREGRSFRQAETSVTRPDIANCCPAAAVALTANKRSHLTPSEHNRLFCQDILPFYQGQHLARVLTPLEGPKFVDLQGLIHPEARGQVGRVYARVFHAKFDETGPKRLGRTLMMREPDPSETRLRLKKADDLAKLIASGGLTVDGGMTEPSPVIAAIVAGMRQAAQAGGSIMDCADAALSEVSQLSPGSLPRAAEPADGAPATVVTPMLQVASSQPIPGTFAGGRPSDPVNVTLIRRLATVEELGGATAAAARNTAMRVLAERDEGAGKVVRIEPPLMSEAEFIARLQAIVERLRSLRGEATRGEAA